ncbi:alpha/beta fold hydrolase [Niveispirillum sp.]|uniref:alpha/beta fold hydrolase n=1 Tax=Niveispirillum sp. TaxID=1917217 RepID=UPI001B565C48|nr:alpha/beta fold hydrolase [Niveispirillum sp.]MBP7338522.1 alpha/beta fold hydrolase [Niveispirillum sp.]
MTAVSETHRIFDTGDCRIHYWIGGPPDAPLVVLTPGAFTDHRMFDDQVAALQTRYRTLRWDPRGHGCSRPYGRAFATDLAADDLKSLLDHLGEEQVALVGQSIGGNISQEMLRRHPRRCWAAVLLGCTCSTIGPTRAERWALRLFPLLMRLYPVATFKRISMEKSAIKAEAQRRLREMIAPLSRGDILAISGGIAGAVQDVPGYAIRHPILISRGEHDALGNIRRIIPLWLDRDPHSRFTEIPDSGHVANCDNPDGFNAVMMAFLDANRPSICTAG